MCVVSCVPLVVVFQRVHWVQVVQGAGLPVSCGVCSVPLSLPFVRLLLLLSCNTCEMCPISLFKGVFSVVCEVYVGLFVSWALRGLCGFCARVELGG